jgi:flagellar hook-basal body complex protein FliE
MAIENISGIESMLAQMRATAKAASSPGPTGKPVDAAGGDGFAAALERSLRHVSDAQNQANMQAHAFELGVPGVSLNNVMINMQKANIAFQATVQVRNRLVAAYQEIASMPV